MKFRRLIFFILSACTLATSILPLTAAEKKSAPSDASQWSKVPDIFLFHRIVQSASAPLKTYRVALIIPPGGGTPRISKSCGRPEVDGIAYDFARESVKKNSQLREMNKTKELVFQLIVGPPALDSSDRSEEGRKPIAAGKEFSAPVGMIAYRTSQMPRSASGEMLVTFPAAGGYAIEACIFRTCGDEPTDGFYIKNALLNWQTSRKASGSQTFRVPFGMKAWNFGGRITG